MSDQLKSDVYTQIVRLLQRILESVAIGDFGVELLEIFVADYERVGQVDVAAQLGDARTAEQFGRKRIT